MGLKNCLPRTIGKAPPAKPSAAADSRSDMLVQMRDYLETKRLPRSEVVFARWVALVARDDVRRAVERVGRIEHYEYYGE